MENNKKQTAVEQFLDAIKNQISLSNEHLEMIESYASQAKEMEKEQQIIDAYNQEICSHPDKYFVNGVFGGYWCPKCDKNVDDDCNIIQNEDECPFNNLIDRLKKQYSVIHNELDLNIDFGDKVPNIFQQYQQALYEKYQIALAIYHGKNDTFYYVIRDKKNVYNSNKMGLNFEFEMTAQMACIEKAFEILNNIKN